MLQAMDKLRGLGALSGWPGFRLRAGLRAMLFALLILGQLEPQQMLRMQAAVGTQSEAETPETENEVETEVAKSTVAERREHREGPASEERRHAREIRSKALQARSGASARWHVPAAANPSYLRPTRC